MTLRHNMAISMFRDFVFIEHFDWISSYSVVVNVLQNSSSNLPEAFVITYKINFQKVMF